MSETPFKPVGLDRAVLVANDKLGPTGRVVSRDGVNVRPTDIASKPELKPSPPYLPLVSILIPAYNAREWIADTLRSAIAQTWPRKEIIVVDDGSSDRTLEIAREFESESITVVTQPNQGAAAARNTAYALSKGEFIQWLDADDLLAPDKIAVQMKVAIATESKQTLLSSAWGVFLYRHRHAKFVPTALWRDLSPVDWLITKLGQNLYMQTATWLVTRELTEAAGPWDTRLWYDDDGEYFCRVLLASDGVRFLPGAKVYYRGPGLAFHSLSHIGQARQKLEAHWLSMQLHIRYLRALEDSERVRAAALRYLKTCLIHFYPENRDICWQMEKLARELGGNLGSPTLSWKYAWVRMLVGWRLAKSAQRSLLTLRWSVQKHVAKTVSEVEKAVTKAPFAT